MSLAGDLHLLRLWLQRRILAGADYGACYDAVAPTYDGWERLMAAHTGQLLAGIAPGSEVLDLACGAGQVGTLLAQAGIAVRLTGVDASPGMLARFCQRHPAATARHGDALAELARAPAAWDAITCAWGLAYLPRRRCFAAIARALRPGGIVGVIVNRAGTLPGLRAAVLTVMRSQPRQVHRLMRLGGSLPRDLAELQGWGRRAGLQPLAGGEGEERVPVADAAAAWDWLDASGAGAGIAACFADPAAVRPALCAAWAPHLAAAGGAVIHRFAWARWRR